nr:hypothetical protein [uncultured Mediterraneibacter sp.]
MAKSKVDEIVELKEILKALKGITEKLDDNISDLKSFLDAKEFIPETLGVSIKEHLEEINQKQADFTLKYEALNQKIPDTKYSVLERELTEIQRVFEENDKYIEALKFFLSLHSEDERTEKILQARKDIIDVAKVGGMEGSDLKKYAEPYWGLQQAFFEEDAMRRFSKLYKLGTYFEEEITMGVQFDTLSLEKKVNVELDIEKDSSEIKKELEESGSCETEESRENSASTSEDIVEKREEDYEIISEEHAEAEKEDSETISVEIIEEEKNISEIISEGSTEEGENISEPISEKFTEEFAEERANTSESISEDIEERETTSEITPEEFMEEEEMKDILVMENPSILRVQMSSKANTKFGVKEFKKDISKQPAKEKIACLIEAFNAGGYSIRSFSEKNNDTTGKYKLATEKLYQLGYLKRYVIEGMGEFFALSPRGMRAFSAKDSGSLLRVYAKGKISTQDPGESIDDTTNAAIIRMLAFEGAIKLRKLIPDYKFIIRINTMEKDYFVDGYPISNQDDQEVEIQEDKVTVWFAGVVTEKKEILTNFMDTVEEDLKTGDILVVTGNTLVQAKAVANWLKTSIDLREVSLCYTSYFENEVFSLETNQPFEVETKTLTKDKSSSYEDESAEFNDEKVEDVHLINEEMEMNAVSGADSDEKKKVEEDCEEGEIENKAVEIVEDKGEIEERVAAVEKQDIAETLEKQVASNSMVLTDEKREQYISDYQKMIISGKTYAASAYLKTLAEKYNFFDSYYRHLAYAVNDPLENCTYSSDTIFNVFYGDTEPVSDYYIIAATLRNYFYDQYSYDYSIHQLYSMLSGNSLFRSNQKLEKIIYDLKEFKNKYHKGIDRYADYREKERSAWEQKLDEIRREAKGYYENYVKSNFKENAFHKRFMETEKLLLGTESDLCEYLGVVVNNDKEMLDMLEEFLSSTYVKDQAVISSENIDPAKINRILDEYWELATKNMYYVKKTSDLMSSLRMNLYKKVYKIVSVLCNYVFIMQSAFTSIDDESLREYKKNRTSLLSNMNEIAEELSEMSSAKLDECAGRIVLKQTLEELKSRLSGEYKDGSYKFYYIDFLKGDKVLLDEEFLPMLDEVPELPDFSAMSRIQLHCNEEEKELTDRIRDIFDGEDDYGSALLILKYLKYQGYTLSADEIERYDIEKAIINPLQDLENKRKEFIGDIELAQSYGQIDNTIENSKEIILQIVESWYSWAIETKNYGFFTKILQAFREKIKNDAQERAIDLQHNLNIYLQENIDWEEDAIINKAVNQIKERIKQQNYAAAEDLLNRVIMQDVDLEGSVQQEDYLEDYLEEYDINYKKTADPRHTLRALVNLSKTNNKDTKGGNRLLENWPKGARVGETTLNNLLLALGFNVESVKMEEPIPEKIENYSVILKRPINGRKTNYKHPISAFGSEAEEKKFRVVCLFGKTDAGRLIDVFKQIGNAKHTLVLLDYALTLADKRKLARKSKTEVGGEKIFAVIDRVVIFYLAKHYMETAINRMLMSIVMPFASYQPYIDKSADVMPPEIFIGRRYELDKIESSTGVNLVYGGRQLGKSALLRMARNNIDHNENNARAVLVEIKNCDYKMAAEKISRELADAGILQEGYVTDEWSELTQRIKKRLKSTIDPIPYLLLMLDEADKFIESCESVDYKPFDMLEEIQGIGKGRFKFVVAGLRNIVRFKRDIALGKNSGLAHLESMTVKPFKAMEARELLEVPLSYLGFRFPKDNNTEVLISTIFGTTNYFPGLLQLYCKKLIEALQRDYVGYSENDTPPYIVKKDHIKKILAEQSLQEEIRSKFFITLKEGDDDYYYIIALLVAFHYHEYKSQNGCSVDDLIEVAKSYSIIKILKLGNEKLHALMEEMRELNVLQHTGNAHYRFTRHSFCQMMGTVSQIEDELMKYMEDK